MSRPTLSDKSPTRRIDMKITEAEVEAINQWAAHSGIPTMSAAIRELISVGLSCPPLSKEGETQP